MMKSYAESKGHPVIDWKKVIKSYQAAPDVDVNKHKDHKALMVEWNTCTCGQLPAIIERHETNKVPVDLVLYRLGLDINEAFKNFEWEAALNLLELITIRGKFLVKKAISDTKDKIKELQEQIKDLEEQLA